MDLTVLGEYALKPALSVGLRLKKLYTSEVDDGIIAAFEFALNDWSKHTPTTSDKVRLSKALEEYIQSSTSYEALDADTRAFIDCFKKKLSEQPAAHNYLMTLRADPQEKSEEQNLLEHHKTQELIQGLIAQLGSLNMSPQDIRALLKELPLEQGLERTESALEKMYLRKRTLSEGVKQLVLEFVRFLFEYTDKISEEAKRLREAGDSYLAETLEEINKALTGESDQSLTAVYWKYEEQKKQDEIRVLEELVKAAQIQLSFGEARDFYERLLKLAPTFGHQFNYAHLLQSLNDFDKARSHYEAALQILREWEEKNPEAYKPNLATILNNLGNLLSDTNDFKQAQAYYMEALQICQDLVEQNSEIYKPDVLMTLNNLGVLFSDTNDFRQAQAYFEKALLISKELAEQNPAEYLPGLAVALSNLGALYGYTNDLKQAQTYFQEGVLIGRRLAELYPETYKPALALILNNLGSLLRKTNKLQQAQDHYEEALKLYQDLVGQNPEAYKPDEAKTLNNLGGLFSDTHDIQRAQAYYEQALLILRELAEQNPEAYLPDVATTLNGLGDLFCKINKLQQAQDYYKEALQTFQALAKENPEAYKPDVAMTQQNLTILYIGLVKIEDAEKAYQEAHDTYRELANHHPRAYEIDYARILGIGFGLLGKPKEYLEEAKEILGKYPEHPKAQELLSLIESLANG